MLLFRELLKLLIYKSFLTHFCKKFDFLKCRKKNRNYFVEFYKSHTTLDFTRVTGTMSIFLIMYSNKRKRLLDILKPLIFLRFIRV